MCEEWSLADQMASLDAKLAAVQHVYANLADVMNTRQARFLNNVVLAITTLSLATFILTVWELVQKRLDPFDGLSLMFAAAAVVASVVVFGGVWWRSRSRVSGTFSYRGTRRA